jgi:hypothetical protein
MIKFEANMLVLDSAVSKDDHQAIYDFIEHIKNEERKNIIDLIKSGKITIS